MSKFKTEKDDNLKFDHGKLRMDLFPVELIREWSIPATYGIAKGYAEDSWKEVGIKRYKAAFLRHHVASETGEYLDRDGITHKCEKVDGLYMDHESNIPHRTMAFWNYSAVLYLEKYGEQVKIYVPKGMEIK